MITINTPLTVEQLKALKLLGIDVQDYIDKYYMVEHRLRTEIDYLGMLNRNNSTQYLEQIAAHLDALNTSEVGEVYLIPRDMLDKVTGMIKNIQGLRNPVFKEFHTSYLDTYNKCYEELLEDVNKAFP